MENTDEMSPEGKVKLEAEILMNNFKSAFLLSMADYSKTEAEW